METDRPNILLITSDQQHWSTLSCLGSEARTPHLDRLASEGTLFTRGYCPNPTCTPSRASMITGMYPSRHGAYALGTKLDERVHTVGEDLQQAGYRTALVGKAHFQQNRATEDYPSIESMGIMQDLAFWKTFHGPFYGFEHVELARNHTDEQLVGQHYALWMEEKGLSDWRRHFRAPTGSSPGQSHRWSLPEEFHYGTWIAERSVALMEQYRRTHRPFFLWASFFDPHPSYLVPGPWDALYDPDRIAVPSATPGEHDRNPPHHRLTQQPAPDFTPWCTSGHALHGMHSHLHDRRRLAKDIAVYYGMISLMDRQIGRILDALDAQGLAENTLVVYSSDHGHFFGQHGLIAKGPFHYEDMIRVPWIVRYPGRVPAARRSDALQSLVDLPPTWLAFAGIPAPAAMSGVDQSAVWTGERPSAREHVVVENRHEPDTIHMKTYVDERYKLTVYFNRPYGELYDLQDDPGEIRNRWDDPAAADLKSRLLLKFLHAEMGKEPVPMPRVSTA